MDTLENIGADVNKQGKRIDMGMGWGLQIITGLVVVVQLLSRVRLFTTHRLLHARLPCPSPSPGACSNSCSLSWG